jgi:hypothetical protein
MSRFPELDRFIGQTDAGVSTGTGDFLTKGQLPPEAMKEYYDLTLVETVMLKEATFHNVDAPALWMDNILVAPGQTTVNQPEMGETADADVALPTFDQTTFAPVPFEYDMPIGMKQFYFRNIEQAGIVARLQRAAGIAFMNDVEDNAINSSTTGSTPAGYHNGMLVETDGWFKKARTYGHSIDTAGEYVNPGLFYDLWHKLPAKWRQQPYAAQFKFYVAPNVLDSFSFWFTAKNMFNPWDFTGNVVEGSLAFRGVPIVPVTKINASAQGVLSRSSVTSGLTSILLCRPQDLVIAYQGGLVMHSALRPRDGKVLYNHLENLYDFGFAFYDTVAISDNIVATIDPALLSA